MYVIINGVSSDTIQGLQVLSLPPITKPKMRRQVDTIDGRDGDIITELGYEAYDRTITVLLHHNYDLDAITAFFNTSGEIIFSNEPDKKYYFRLLEKIDYERAVQFKTANITFHVQPYKYPVNEAPLTVSSTAWEGTDYDQTPYIFRAVSDSSVEVGNREILEQITGGTIAYNQLCNASSVTIASGHKYYMKKGTAYSIGASTGSAITGLTSGSDMLIDLTQMFGSTIADYIYQQEQSQVGKGVSLFKSLFPKDYYPYNAGELMSVKTSAHEMTGKNRLPMNKANEVKTYAGITVTAQDGVYTITGTATSTTYISFELEEPVDMSPSTTKICFLNNVNDSNLSVGFYRGSTRVHYWAMTPMNRVASGWPDSGNEVVDRIAIMYQSGSTYNATVSPMFVGLNVLNATAYEPYTVHTYPLSNIELRGIPKLVNNRIQYDGDIYKSDGSVERRFGIVDLGTLSWVKRAGTNHSDVYYFQSSEIQPHTISTSNNTVNPFINSKGYTCTFLNSVYRGNADNKSAGLNSNMIQIRDDDYTDASAFKTAMSGVYLVYELASPTTETTTPYTETQICSPYGTEEFIDGRDVAVPVGHKTRYMQINDPAEIIVPNAGNVPSAPTIQLTGSGTVGVYLGNAQTLQVNIPEDGITIDTEAQDATSNGQLANRSVTGDYDSLRLQPGDNDVSFSGDFSVVITKYTRWV